MVDDSDDNGRADSFEIFFEGEKDSMDLAVHEDGSIYLATRRKIVRLEDTDNDGVADKTQLIVQLETTGNYPHNGLSGLVFDATGYLQFGFGENLGETYTLIGADGASLFGGAEGGSTYRCSPEGNQLERIATGFWNPFGQCMDAFGNIFAVDNDPDATPPCRLLHVTKGANFGYQFRYGRPGNHPLQTWTGKLPGTIGMVAGTGEAPCEIVYCAPNPKGGLPDDYVGDLLVASWGDHRIERYTLQRKGASFEATRSIVVQGDATFWPVGIAVAPDGSLFVTDWGSRSYPLHGEGKIWHLASMQPVKKTARKPSRTRKHHDQATAMRSLETTTNELLQIANSAETAPLRALAVKLLGSRGHDMSEFAKGSRALSIRREALRYLKTSDRQLIEDALQENDAILRSLAVHALAQNKSKLPTTWFSQDFLASPPSGQERLAVGAALACEAINDGASQQLIPALMRSAVEDVQFVAARWIADHNLMEHLPLVENAISSSRGNIRLLLALVGTKRHLEGGKLNSEHLATALTNLLQDESQGSTTKTLALRAAKPGTLPMALIEAIVHGNDEALQREAIFLLLGDERERARTLLDEVVSNEDAEARLRADALIVMEPEGQDVERLVALASHDSTELRVTAVRLLTGGKLNAEQRARFTASINRIDSRTERESERRSAVKRLLGGHVDEKPRSVSDWIAVVSNEGSKERGRRLFHNTRLLQCSKCHQVNNRGENIGPELTGIANTQSKEQLLRSIVNPSERIAPQYQPWTIVSDGGKVRTGYHLASKRLVETFVDANGERFEVAQDAIEQRVPVKQSIMPSGLIDHLTAEEVSDLLAYLSE